MGQSFCIDDISPFWSFLSHTPLRWYCGSVSSPSSSADRRRESGQDLYFVFMVAYTAGHKTYEASPFCGKLFRAAR